MKKGFTLIELLAVIVILAVIALIATPMVLNVVDEAKDSAIESKLKMYADKVRVKKDERLFYGEQVDNNNLSSIVAEIDEPKLTCTSVNYDDYVGAILYGCDVDNRHDYCYKNGIVKQGEEDCAAFLDNTRPIINSVSTDIVIQPNTDSDIKTYVATTFGVGGGDVTCNINNTNELTNSDNEVTCVAAGKNTLTASTTFNIKVAYEVTYDLNGGEGETAIQYKGVSDNLTIDNPTPTKEGFNFIGWSTSPTSKTADYTNGSSYSDNSNVKLYAVWQSIYLNNNVEIGDYIYMRPTLSSYPINYTESGHSYNQTMSVGCSSWRVIKINENGTFDAICNSTGGSATLNSFKINMTSELNYLCGKYQNSAYTTTARSVLVSDSTNIINAMGTRATGSEYFTGTVYTSGQQSGVYVITAGGDVDGTYGSYFRAIRPILTFKANILTPTGDGKSSSTAWHLN